MVIHLTTSYTHQDHRLANPLNIENIRHEIDKERRRSQTSDD